MPLEDPRREASQGCRKMGAPARKTGSEESGPPENSPGEREPQTGHSPDRTPALVAKRKTRRQATSAVAYTAPEPAPGDPLLDFEPVPHVAPRRNSITPDLQRAFIAHLAATGIVTEAARHIGKSMEAIYKLRARPGAESFRAAWEAAVDRGVARLEAGALARAIEGEERMVVSAGQCVGTERRHNEALVMFFLRHRMPRRYAKDADIGPGHPVYERVKREYEAERRAEANDPARVRRIQDSIGRKMEEWRAEFEAQWRSERAAREREEERRARG